MSKSEVKLRVGVLGAGFMGQTYARAVATLVPNATLAGIAGGTRSGQLARESGVRHFATPEELVADRGIDLVCIATPHAAHGRQGLAAANAGKHLVIEKPMACTVAECDAVLAAGRKTGAHCAVMFTQRFRTSPVAARQLIISGRFGRVLQMSSVQIVPDGMQTAVPRWQLEPENVGILMGHGIHNIDQARWLTGQEVRSVFAKVRSVDAKYPVDGTSDVLLTMADGCVVSIHCSFEVAKPGFERTGGATRIVCERGLIDLDWYGEVRASHEGGPWEVVARQEPIDWSGKGFLDPVRLRSYAENIRNVIAAAAGRESLRAAGWDGRQAVAVAVAAYESSRTGREVPLAPPRT